MRLAPVVLVACTVALPAFASSETRSVSGFTRIDLMAPVDLEVRPGKFGASLEMDSEVARHLTTEVQGDTLRIAFDGRNLNVHSKQRIKVTLPELRGVHIQGSGDADIAGFKDQEKVEIRISGSGDVKFAGTAGGLAVWIEGSGDVLLAGGQAGSLQARIQGSGNLKATEFKAKNVSVAIDGSGDADVRVAGGALSLSVNGSGDIRWTGEASAVSTATHGSGSIAKR
ncbi:MAG TPA: head GIN domain-containing protein [Myxococcaceae bacterium]|nr:head GIN domain-containing protein [Myxococcaceae bacterium]